MGIFSDALLKGLDAQARLEQCRSDLTTALQEVGRDLSEFSGSQVVVSLGQVTTFVSAAQTYIEAGLGYVPKQVERAKWQIAVKSVGVTIPLADVEFSEAGYPLYVRWPGKSARAYDEDGIARALQELLSSRYAGERLRGILTPAASPPSSPEVTESEASEEPPT